MNSYKNKINIKFLYTHWIYIMYYTVFTKEKTTTKEERHGWSLQQEEVIAKKRAIQYNPVLMNAQVGSHLSLMWYQQLHGGGDVSWAFAFCCCGCGQRALWWWEMLIAGVSWQWHEPQIALAVVATCVWHQSVLVWDYCLMWSCCWRYCCCWMIHSSSLWHLLSFGFYFFVLAFAQHKTHTSVVAKGVACGGVVLCSAFDEQKALCFALLHCYYCCEE